MPSAVTFRAAIGAAAILLIVAIAARRGRVQLVNTATYVGGTPLPHAPERPPAPWVAADLPAVQRLHARR
jgi:hypothetical protein